MCAVWHAGSETGSVLQVSQLIRTVREVREGGSFQLLEVLPKGPQPAGRKMGIFGIFRTMEF